MTTMGDLIDRDAREFIELRHDLHRHPELAYQEHRTSGIVAKLLREWGYEVETGVGGTGVVGRLAKCGSARTLGIRADMDALPIREATGLAYASVNEGVMHACGHDGHTAILLAAAKALAEAGRFDGALNLIFQPAEEYGRPGSGAARMISEGIFDRYPCDAIFGLHTMPGLPQGTLNFRAGPIMAASGSAVVTIDGRGGHAAAPHKTADPVVAAAAIVMALQTIVSRNVDPLQPAVVTVGALHAGTVDNVIPAQARLELTIRAFSNGVRDLMKDRVEALVTAQASSFGVKAAIAYRPGYPAVVNKENETNFAIEVGRAVVGPGAVVEAAEPMLASEDFAYMLDERAGSYFFIGNSDETQSHSVPLHHPGFDFNDSNIAVGAKYWAALTERYLTPAI